ncbi:FMN reductase [Solicola gregarius]|uniref:FMN reductase n=1 Tax=Solicola gregarius TaxID=2908642 RepID=A0AA46TFE0_9ACTN|nr:FMN reductase [Solicola gregarius]UYM04342.1 FMN reductase [Solicola gregarius]
MTGTNPKIVVISAGLGQPSTTRMLADRLAEAAKRRLRELGAGASVDTYELRGLAHQVTDAMLTGFAGPDLQTVLTAVEDADALIVVTPTFQGSYGGLFKSFMDVVDAEALIGTPVVVAATGGSARHSLVLDHALRPLFTYLQALVVPTGVFAGPGDWGDAGDGSRGLAERVDQSAGELASLLAGAGTGRRREDEFDMDTDSMLAASRP